MNFLSGGKKDNPAEQQIKGLLYDDSIQVLSSFELNKIASLTYGDIVCDEIFELLENIVARPMNCTPLTIQKALVITKHVLIYGSEKCVNHVYGIGQFIDNLRSYNTVLMAHQAQGAMGMWQRIQGGGVDKGGPVREAATAVCQLISNIDQLQRIRNSSADPNSLVPIGDSKVAFVTEEVRLLLLQKKIQEQQRINLKSNLAKSEGGFGGGYNATDGKSVVGAAHGIEEMIKMAKISKRGQQKYSDDGEQGQDYRAPEEEAILEELAAEHRAAQAAAAAASAPDPDTNFLSAAHSRRPPQGNVDLLDFGGGGGGDGRDTSSAHATGDLLDGHDFFGGGAPTSASSAYQHDPFGFDGGSGGGGALGGTSGGDDLLAMTSMSAPAADTPSSDPFGFAPAVANTAPAVAVPGIATATSSTLGGATTSMASMGISNGASNVPPKRSIMGSNVDRFAALDALTPAGNPTTALDSKNAQNRLLSFTGSSSLDAISASSTTTTSMYDASPAGDRSNPGLSLSMGGMAPPPSPPPQPMGMPPAAPPRGMKPAGAGQIAGTYIVGDTSPDDDDNPFLMGGTVGAGLEPVAPAPGAPPPPPPPAW
jgi:hypothetical protein